MNQGQIISLEQTLIYFLCIYYKDTYRVEYIIHNQVNQF